MPVFVPLLMEVSCAVVVVALSAGLAAVVLLGHHAPALTRLAKKSLKWFLTLSCRGYFALLRPLASYIQTRWNCTMLTGSPRLVLTVLLSCGFGQVLSWILGWQVGCFMLIAFAAHGVAVHLLWDEAVIPQGLQIGETIS